jgi:hypothetical protein
MAEIAQLIEGVTAEIVNHGLRLVRAAVTRTEGSKAFSPTPRTPVDLGDLGRTC